MRREGGVVGVLLAAGAGTRFGGEVPKPLVPFRGRPLVAWPLAALLGGGVERVVVVVGAEGERVGAGVAALDGAVLTVSCAEWSEGLSASLRAGVAAAASEGDAVVVALADQPLLAAEAVARVIAARHPATLDAVRATYAGAPGHPTLLESSLFAAVDGLRGDAGARGLLGASGVRVAHVACDGLGRPDDADTPQALARMAAGARPGVT